MNQQIKPSMRLSNDFDLLVHTYKQLLLACAEALEPGKTQEERDRMKNAIYEYLNHSKK